MPPRSHAVPPSQRCERVLLVDDERLITELLAERLAAQGFSVTVAHDGAEAFDRALADSPDLIISDLQMPYVDGLALCRMLVSQDSTRSIPVVLLTASSSVPDPSEYPNIRRVIRKPFCISQIVTRSIELLGPPAQTVSRESPATR